MLTANKLIDMKTFLFVSAIVTLGACGRLMEKDVVTVSTKQLLREVRQSDLDLNNKELINQVIMREEILTALYAAMTADDLARYQGRTMFICGYGKFATDLFDVKPKTNYRKNKEKGQVIPSLP
jgi:hypothetical protein